MKYNAGKRIAERKFKYKALIRGDFGKSGSKKKDGNSTEDHCG